MASPAAKASMRAVALRKLEIAAQESGSEEQLEAFRAHIEQPVYGDFEMRDILTLQAAADLLAVASGAEIEEDDLKDEAFIGEYHAEKDESVESRRPHITLQEAEAAQGQNLDPDPVPSDERDGPSDEEVLESRGAKDIDVRQRNEELKEKQEKAEASYKERRAAAFPEGSEEEEDDGEPPSLSSDEEKEEDKA